MIKNDIHILIADDQAENRFILDSLLGDAYSVHGFSDGQQVLDYLAAGHPADLILLDIVMPGLDGYETCRRIKATPRTWDIQVLFLSSLDSPDDEERGFALGADDFIRKPFSPPVVLARVRNHLKIASSNYLLRSRNNDLERLVQERTDEVLRQSRLLAQRNKEVIVAQDATISAFCALAEARDNETGNHIRRTQNYVRTLAQHLRDHPRFRHELNNESIHLLYKSAPLHDIGKVAIPDAILLKPGKLSADEWKVMRRHCQFGHDAILSAELELGESADFLRYAREIALGHHEKWDGSGYPHGLVGDAIPISARLMAAADVYDALISRRVYKPPYSHEEALAMINEGRGTHFDPDVADAVAHCAEQFRIIAAQFSDEILIEEVA